MVFKVHLKEAVNLLLNPRSRLDKVQHFFRNVYSVGDESGLYGQLLPQFIF